MSASDVTSYGSSVDLLAIDTDGAVKKLAQSVLVSGASLVQTTRTISTTAPLSGGGDLSANRTLSISAATTSAAGSMSSTDKTKLDAITSGTWTATITNETALTGTAVSKASYSRNGSIVTFRVYGTTTTSGAGPTRRFDITMPVASTTPDGFGPGSTNSAAASAARVFSQTATTLRITWNDATAGLATTWVVTGQYEVN